MKNDIFDKENLLFVKYLGLGFRTNNNLLQFKIAEQYWFKFKEYHTSKNKAKTKILFPLNERFWQ